jgi:hypothetical protein
MLAKSGKLPTRGQWSYEVKWDGFRAIVSTEGPLRVRSRRGWDMTEHVRFLEQLPVPSCRPFPSSLLRAPGDARAPRAAVGDVAPGNDLFHGAHARAVGASPIKPP